jgi:hypothetical protein
MSRSRLTLVSALASLFVLLTVAAGTASAQDTGTINISGVEEFAAFGVSQDLNVTGTGACAAAGAVQILVGVTDEVTGGSGAAIVNTQCESAGQHIQWLATAVVTNMRPGDTALVDVTANGAISDTDQKEVVIKQFH